MSWNVSMSYIMPYRHRMVMACSKYGHICSLKNVLLPFRGWRLGQIEWYHLWMTSLVLQVSVIDSTITRNLFVPAATRHQVFSLLSLETFPTSLAFKSPCSQSLSELRSKLNEVYSMGLLRLQLMLYLVSQLKMFRRPCRRTTRC